MNAMSTMFVQSRLYSACGAGMNEEFPVCTSRPNFPLTCCPVTLQKPGWKVRDCTRHSQNNCSDGVGIAREDPSNACTELDDGM